MKVIKLDGRYAGYPRWKYMIQFPTSGRMKHKDYFVYARTFKEVYGPATEANPAHKTGDWSTPFWIYNDLWHSDFNRQRILFKDEYLMTMVVLKMNG